MGIIKLHQLQNEATETGRDIHVGWPVWHCPAVIEGGTGRIRPESITDVTMRPMSNHTKDALLAMGFLGIGMAALTIWALPGCSKHWLLPTIGLASLLMAWHSWPERVR